MRKQDYKGSIIINSHKRYKSLFLILLRSEGFITSNELAEKLDVSSRTIKNDIKVIRNEIYKYGVRLVSKPGIGYALYIIDINKYRNIRRLLQHYNVESLPDEFDKRIYYIMEKLLLSKTPIKTEELLEEMYIGRTSLSREIKEIRKILKKYHIQLNIIPHNGIYIEGSEFYIRLCMIRLYRNSNLEYRDLNNEFIKCFYFDETQEDKIKKIIIYGLISYDIILSDIKLDRLVDSILLIYNRIKIGYKVVIPIHMLEEIQYTLEFKFTVRLEEQLRKELLLPKLDINEIGFIAIIILISVDLYRFKDCTYDRYGIFYNEAIDMKDLILDEVGLILGINNFGDSQCSKDLIKLLIPISVKCRFKIHDQMEIYIRNMSRVINRNPLINIVMQNIEKIFKDRYDYELILREKVLIGQVLEGVLSRIELSYKKLNIGLLAIDGRLSTQMVKSYLQNKYGKYINRIETKVLYEMGTSDIDDIDFFVCLSYGKYLSIPYSPIYYIEEDLFGKEDVYSFRKAFLKSYLYHEKLPSIKIALKDFNDNNIKSAVNDLLYDIKLNNIKFNKVLFGEKDEGILLFSSSFNKDDIFSIYVNRNFKKSKDYIKYIVICMINFNDNEEKVKMFAEVAKAISIKPGIIDEMVLNDDYSYENIMAYYKGLK